MKQNECKQCKKTCHTYPHYKISDVGMDSENGNDKYFCSKECMRRYIWESIEEDMMELSIAYCR